MELNLLIRILITFISYFIYPFFKYIIIGKNKQFESKQIQKVLIINSIVVAIIYLIIGYIVYKEEYQVNFIPATFYYFINYEIIKEFYKTRKNKSK